MQLRPRADERAGLLKPPEIGVTSHEIHHLPNAGPYEDSIEGRNRFCIPPGRKQVHAIEGSVGLWWKGIKTKGSFDPGDTLLRATDICQQLAHEEWCGRIVWIKSHKSLGMECRFIKAASL